MASPKKQIPLKKLRAGALGKKVLALAFFQKKPVDQWIFFTKFR